MITSQEVNDMKERMTPKAYRKMMDIPSRYGEVVDRFFQMYVLGESAEDDFDAIGEMDTSTMAMMLDHSEGLALECGDVWEPPEPLNLARMPT